MSRVIHHYRFGFPEICENPKYRARPVVAFSPVMRERAKIVDAVRVACLNSAWSEKQIDDVLSEMRNATDSQLFHVLYRHFSLW